MCRHILITRGPDEALPRSNILQQSLPSLVTLQPQAPQQLPKSSTPRGSLPDPPHSTTPGLTRLQLGPSSVRQRPSPCRLRTAIGVRTLRAGGDGAAATRAGPPPPPPWASHTASATDVVATTAPPCVAAHTANRGLVSTGQACRWGPAAG